MSACEDIASLGDEEARPLSSSPGHGAEPGAPAPRPPATLGSAGLASLAERRAEFLRYFRRNLETRSEAEDAVQDFYLKVIHHAGTLRDQRKLDAWLRQILRNTLVDHYRRRAARLRTEAALGRDPPSAVVDPGTVTEPKPCACAERELPTLRPVYADILRRADLNGQSRQTIAAELGLSVNNAEVRLHRARRALKRRLEQSCPSCGEHGFLDCRCAPNSPDRVASAARARTTPANMCKAPPRRASLENGPVTAGTRRGDGRAGRASLDEAMEGAAMVQGMKPDNGPMACGCGCSSAAEGPGHRRHKSARGETTQAKSRLVGAERTERPHPTPVRPGQTRRNAEAEGGRS